MLSGSWQGFLRLFNVAFLHRYSINPTPFNRTTLGPRKFFSQRYPTKYQDPLYFKSLEDAKNEYEPASLAQSRNDEHSLPTANPSLEESPVADR